MAFPAGRTLIVPPSQLWSKGGAGYGTGLKPRYLGSWLTDGSAASAVASEFKTGTFTVATPSCTPNIFGVIHHNIDIGNVCVFSSDGGLLRGAAARRPNFWLDLRGFPSTGGSWTLNVNDNSRPLMVGEIVIATGFEFDGTLRTAPNETVTFLQTRQEMQYGKVAISAMKASVRNMTLELSLNYDEVLQLEQVAVEANESGDYVVVVPDTRRNDIWFVRWPLKHELRYTRSAVADVQVTLSLVEESAGVVI